MLGQVVGCANLRAIDSTVNRIILILYILLRSHFESEQQKHNVSLVYLYVQFIPLLCFSKLILNNQMSIRFGKTKSIAQFLGRF